MGKGLYIIPSLALAALPWAAAGGTAAGGAAKKTPPKRPNILYIMTDQQCYDMIRAISGNKYISTPNFDRLVESGFTFANAWCASPLSVPSRFALTTGLSPAQYDARTNNTTPESKDRILEVAKNRSMGALFRAAGYDTYYAGKIHLPWANENTMDHYQFEYLEKSEREALADAGTKFFREHTGDKPFLFFFSFIQPHDICSNPYLLGQSEGMGAGRVPQERTPADMRDDLKRFRQLLESQNPAIFEADSSSAPLPFNQAPTDKYPQKVNFKYTPEQWRQYKWIYYRLVEEADREVGQVLDAFYASPYKDNTIVIFTADHGDMGGSHGRVGKEILYTECQRVPFIFSGPGVRHGMDHTSMVCNGWDLLPTMCDIAGIKKPDGLCGESLWPYITKGSPLPQRPYLFFEIQGSYEIMESDGSYAYVRYEPVNGRTLNNSEVLFDMKKDPGQLHNCINDNKECREKAAELSKILDSELQKRQIIQTQ